MQSQRRETIPLICNAQYTIKIQVLIENLELKMFFIGQPWWPADLFCATPSYKPRSTPAFIFETLLYF